MGRKKKLSYDQIFNDIVRDAESKVTTYSEAGYFRVSLFSYIAMTILNTMVFSLVTYSVKVM